MSIRYDDNRIKRPYSEHEYTNEQVLELEKCSQDINEFTKYIRIVNPDKGEMDFKPYDYQVKLLNALHRERFTISLQSRQSGKCVHSSTMVSVRNKNTGKIEKITIEEFFNKFSK